MPDALDQAGRDQLDRLLSGTIFFPDGFKTWVTDWFATNVPLIPYTHFLGARLNIARSGDFIATDESTASATYANLSTIGPSISGIADGDYLVMFGAFSTGQGSVCSREINGAAADDAFGIWQNESAAALARGDIVSLKNNNNSSIVLKYRKDGGGSANFSNRWLVIIRISTG